MRNQGQLADEKFFCARCKTVFHERPTCCLFCDGPQHATSQDNVVSSFVAYILLCFGPLLLGLLAVPFVGWVGVALACVLYALVLAGTSVFLVLTWSFILMRNLFLDARKIEREIEVQATRPIS